jgi:Spy/CpxP family protein refolding chaperone
MQDIARSRVRLSKHHPPEYRIYARSQTLTGEQDRMTRHCACVFLLTFCCSVAAYAAPLGDCQHGDTQKGDAQKKPDAPNSQDPPRFKWWLQPDTRKDLKLTDQQVQKIDQIFEAFIPKQRERWHEIEKLDQALSTVINDSTAEVTVVAQQVEKLEKLRAEERTARAVMIYKIRLLLNPEQRVKVDAIRARMEEERRRQDEERRRQGRGDKSETAARR